MKRPHVLVAFAVMSCGLVLGGCGSDRGSPGGDGSSGADVMTVVDAGVVDGQVVDAGVVDAGAVDAGDLCGPQDQGLCLETNLDCLCCPAGGPMNNCLCTTSCLDDADCTAVARPHCNQPDVASQGICTALDYPCAWGAVCAAPDTPVATPTGRRALASLAVGELVYSLHEGSLQAVPILAVSRTAVTHHRVRHLRLSNGAELYISPGHPTYDGRPFANLAAGAPLGGVHISSIEDVPYRHVHTYDILPGSDTGTYVAGGALIGSTLWRPPER